MMAENIKPIERQLMEAVGRCWLTIKQAGQRFLTAKGFDLTLEQIMALSIIEKNDGLNPGRIAQEIDRDRTTVTRMLDGLERRNLVVRVPDKSDNRQKLVYLTKLARQRLAELDIFAAEFIARLSEGEKAAEISASVTLLSRVTERAKSW